MKASISATRARAISSLCLTARIAQSAFGFQQQITASFRRSCSLGAIEWKSCVQPNFDKFGECTVGPWIQMCPDATKYEVEEVMRSCGGAIQGIRELPLRLVFPDPSKSSDQRTYHNRADGGFVYVNDGAYSAGPEQCIFEPIEDEGNESLFMSSLSFGMHRLWLTSTLKSVSNAVKQCKDVGTAVALNCVSLGLSRPTSEVQASINDIESAQQSSVTWDCITRVRMPSISQPWSLARAKWQKTTIDTDKVESPKTECPGGPLLGSASVQFISENNEIFGDLIDEGFTVTLQAISEQSKIARSAIRCYDKDGQLISVAFLEGSLDVINHC